MRAMSHHNSTLVIWDFFEYLNGSVIIHKLTFTIIGAVDLH